MKEDFVMKAFKPIYVNELSDCDMIKRLGFSETFLAFLNPPSSYKTVLFTYECAIYRSCKSLNVYFW